MGGAMQRRKGGPNREQGKDPQQCSGRAGGWSGELGRGQGGLWLRRGQASGGSVEGRRATGQARSGGRLLGRGQAGGCSDEGRRAAARTRAGGRLLEREQADNCSEAGRRAAARTRAGGRLLGRGRAAAWTTAADQRSACADDRRGGKRHEGEQGQRACPPNRRSWPVRTCFYRNYRPEPRTPSSQVRSPNSLERAPPTQTRHAVTTVSNHVELSSARSWLDRGGAESASHDARRGASAWAGRAILAAVRHVGVSHWPDVGEATFWVAHNRRRRAKRRTQPATKKGRASLGRLARLTPTHWQPGRRGTLREASRCSCVCRSPTPPLRGRLVLGPPRRSAPSAAARAVAVAAPFWPAARRRRRRPRRDDAGARFPVAPLLPVGDRADAGRWR